jgi:hypothetical protein
VLQREAQSLTGGTNRMHAWHGRLASKRVAMTASARGFRAVAVAMSQ